MVSIDREFDIDRSTLVLGLRGVLGKTPDGREALMITSANYLLRIELAMKINEAKRSGQTAFTISKRVNLAEDVDRERIRSCIDKMKGKITLLPDGYDYALGPCIDKTAEGEDIFYEMANDWGIYQVRRSIASP